ncbi:50S ribosomal protein L11 methyltransferase [Pseudoroseomonas deserti]|uniref:Ribosomal protein L11 methyltransferase n=1 Tax=Teichococcus deserti TaxID=1817963 RepID=A0A1V2H5K1_9PROT|nr:50S ribosomal protein L11 methyltransferase [Pseudoroseomonas deserti]ONG56542.1 50S ribosomal protein L11 methyltransferase [Pseudoroseomonas deserti]
MNRRHPPLLETLTIDGLPEEAVPLFESALQSVCPTVGYFKDDPTDTWGLEAVRELNQGDEELLPALVLAAALAGIELPELKRAPVEADGWLARTVQAFPEQEIGGRVLIRPTHVPDRPTYGRTVLKLDAGLAFGSGEHGSTRGCLIGFEGMAHRRPRSILDIGTGSGILAMAAAKQLKRRVQATDIEPWSVRIAADNAVMNGLRNLLQSRLADGWKHRAVRSGRYDLVFANILARPLCSMAKQLSDHLNPGGTAILAGLLGTQVRMVLAAHRRAGMVLERRIDQGHWSALVLRKR